MKYELFGISKEKFYSAAAHSFFSLPIECAGINSFSIRPLEFKITLIAKKLLHDCWHDADPVFYARARNFGIRPFSYATFVYNPDESFFSEMSLPSHLKAPHFLEFRTDGILADDESFNHIRKEILEEFFFDYYNFYSGKIKLSGGNEIRFDYEKKSICLSKQPLFDTKRNNALRDWFKVLERIVERD